MAHLVDIFHRRQCRRLRSDLVDLAEGTVDESRRRHVEAHVAECTECAEALASLRDLPGSLRGAGLVERNEEFWRGQRREILRAIREAREEHPRHLSIVARRAGLAAVAAGLVALLGYEQLRPVSHPETRVAASIDSLDAGSMVSLLDESAGLLSLEELLPAGASEIQDLTDEDIDTLDGLVGNEIS